MRVNCHHERLFHSSATGRTETYTLSLNDALPISMLDRSGTDSRELLRALLAQLLPVAAALDDRLRTTTGFEHTDRKSTRLNSSHVSISYAVFCLKKKNLGKHLH